MITQSSAQAPRKGRAGKRVRILRAVGPDDQFGAAAPADADAADCRHAAAAAELALARQTYALRCRRHRFLSADLFGEPTWDILLDLFIAAHEGRRVPTTSACIGAHVPPTTALRWLRILEARGLVEREEDGRDGRRTFVKLSRRGLVAMTGFMQASLASLQLAVPELRGAQQEGFALAAE
ncbi:MarR family transcriptional regulator [Novosphingobium sp. Chol11]|uniref:MarR family transcriptional regulator n=1 Tax=Novosphingobium sp. Chol11 TaxID=1385763 RepID=UPI0025FA40BE|nr:MarR family transcriptional regulator [Novosphingobium sp. Chol11]